MDLLQKQSGQQGAQPYQEDKMVIDEMKDDCSIQETHKESEWKRRISENPPIVYYEKAKTSKRETCLLEDTRNMLQMVVT